jgi:hypothetical protein
MATTALITRKPVGFTVPAARKGASVALSKASKEALAQVQRLKGQLGKYKQAVKDNVHDVSRPVAGILGAGVAGSIRGVSFIVDGDGRIKERRIAGFLPWDLVVSTLMAAGGLAFDPDETGRLLHHAGMGGFAFRAGLAASEAIGEFRLGPAWTDAANGTGEEAADAEE